MFILMKKLLLLLVVVSCISQVNAQDSLRYNFYFNNNWCLDFNLKLGLESQNLSTYNMVANYPNALNSHVGNLNFTNGLSFGFDAQIGYFFGIKQNFGIGTGILFLQQQGDITLNQFHVEYKSIDYKQDTFRQLITAHSPLKETITTTNFNIPLLAKYKNQFNYQLGFSIDAGILLNIAINNQYNTNAQFDYEAVYKIDTRKDGSHIAVYDATPAPPYNATDILLTKAGAAANQQSNYNQYFDSLYKQGYNVKLGASAKNTKGTASYTSGTIGFMIQPAINYKINQTWGLNLGAFYVFQPFSNNANNSYRLTDKVGSYNSVINAVSTNYNHSYGINIGVRMYIGKNKITENLNTF